jgi:integrase
MSQPHSRRLHKERGGGHAGLKGSMLAPRTNSAYHQALLDFLSYCDRQRITDAEIGDSLSQLDSVVSRYVQQLYDCGGKLYQASHLLNAFHFYLPRCKGHLLLTQQLLKGWTKLQLKTKVYRRPLTKELTTVLAMSLLKSGHVRAAAATLLAFDCYLRVSELCNIRVCDVGLPRSRHFGSAFTGMVIGLSHTKTGPMQSVAVKSPLVSEIITLLIKSTDKPSTSTDLLFGLNVNEYRTLFREACDTCGLSQYHFTPHCMRHGAATADYVSDPSKLDAILLRGRWRDSKSLRIYINSGVFLSLQVTETKLQRLGEQLLAVPDELLLQFSRKLTRT